VERVDRGGRLIGENPRHDTGPSRGENPRRGELARVVETLPNEMLLVETENGDRVAVHASGKMRVRIVRVLAGDRVRIERSPFDATKGRIVAID